MRLARKVWHARGLLQTTGVIPMLLVTTAAAPTQQTTTAVPCSPSATTTLEKGLSSPSALYGGEINLSAEQSEPCRL